MRRIIAAGLLGGAALAPLTACWGHGAAFLVGELHWLDRDRVRLEVTADWEEHPLLGRRDVARQEMVEAFEIRSKGEWRPWFELAELHWEDREDWPELVRASLDLQGTEGPHRLLTAVWEAAVADPALELRVAKGVALDLLLARRGEGAGKTRWKILITGDQVTLARPEPTPATSGWNPVWLVGVVVLAIGLWSWRRIDKRRRSP